MPCPPSPDFRLIIQSVCSELHKPGSSQEQHLRCRRQPRYLQLTDRKLCAPASRRACPFAATVNYGTQESAICRPRQTPRMSKKMGACESRAAIADLQCGPEAHYANSTAASKRSAPVFSDAHHTGIASASGDRRWYCIARADESSAFSARWLIDAVYICA